MISKRAVSTIEIGVGTIGMLFVVAAFIYWILRGIAVDPHGFVLASISILGGLGALFAICGLISLRWKAMFIPTQVALLLGCVIFYVEIFTSHAGFFF